MDGRTRMRRTIKREYSDSEIPIFQNCLYKLKGIDGGFTLDLGKIVFYSGLPETLEIVGGKSDVDVKTPTRLVVQSANYH
ncbi:hypothetical protein HPP92_000370 [Vanilla planifolia]|uniref:Uncharacterized protein n=1 Tax=Vanilla planifolia TaxID=51239 RepID=A0A835RPT8_VANPL|nr:hypothetical protein HPP92_000370 [Vanilla planifolia]